jgi:hypothetical protein
MKKIQLEEFYSSFSKKRALCYVDSIHHAKKILQIQNTFCLEIKCISSNKKTLNYLSRRKVSCLYFSNRINLIFHLVKIRNESFSFLLAACVDQDAFNLIYLLSKFTHLLTFDEGYFTIKPNSRFNDESIFPFKTQKRNKLLNLIFKFPKTPKFYLKQSLFHFGWFKKALYKFTAIDSDKIISMESLESREMNNIYKIFIGQPFKWMGLSKQNYEEIAEFIKLNEINLYIQHPRETLQNSILDKIDISVLSFSHGAESFINKVGDFNAELEIYSFMSTLCLEINPSIKIKLIDLTLPNELQVEFDDFKNILEISRA